MDLDVNEEGFLNNPADWNEEVMYELARRDGVELTDEHVKYILDLREIFLTTGSVPSIREFAKKHGMDRKAKRLNELFNGFPMDRLTRYSASPSPKGIW